MQAVTAPEGRRSRYSVIVSLSELGNYKIADTGRDCTAAMMCRTWSMRLFPARESRWWPWPSEEASSDAVPFQKMNRLRLANWWTKKDVDNRHLPDPCAAA